MVVSGLCLLVFSSRLGPLILAGCLLRSRGFYQFMDLHRVDPEDSMGCQGFSGVVGIDQCCTRRGTNLSGIPGLYQFIGLLRLLLADFCLFFTQPYLTVVM